MSTNTGDTEETSDTSAPQAKGRRTAAKKAKPARKARKSKKAASKPQADGSKSARLDQVTSWRPCGRKSTIRNIVSQCFAMREPSANLYTDSNLT